ncbi:hypothetical protein [Pantoea vagans]|uniref:hypothetical protein n=1 Tax=Pantoea vagans TaxID=470934 RepID=UPI00241F0D46|nr:hypothetical protein [Pantoea vagans]
MANLTKEQRAARQAEDLQKQQAEQQQLEQQRTELDQQRQELEQQQQQLVLQQEQLVQDQQQLNQERQQLEQDRQQFDAGRNLALLQASLEKPVAGVQGDVDASGVATFSPFTGCPKSVSMVRNQPEFPGGPTEASVHSDNVQTWLEHGWRVAAED